MRKLLSLAVFVAGLKACNSIEGAGKDTKDGSEVIEYAAERASS